MRNGSPKAPVPRLIYFKKSGISRSSSSFSGLRGWRCGGGWWVAGELLGPVVGQECWVGGGEAGVGGCGLADGWCAVRTGSPACGRAEWVVPVPARPWSVFGTGTVSSVGVPAGT